MTLRLLTSKTIDMNRREFESTYLPQLLNDYRDFVVQHGAPETTERPKEDLEDLHRMMRLYNWYNTERYEKNLTAAKLQVNDPMHFEKNEYYIELQSDIGYIDQMMYVIKWKISKEGYQISDV